MFFLMRKNCGTFTMRYAFDSSFITNSVGLPINSTRGESSVVLTSGFLCVTISVSIFLDFCLIS